MFGNWTERRALTQQSMWILSECSKQKAPEHYLPQPYCAPNYWNGHINKDIGSI